MEIGDQHFVGVGGELISLDALGNMLYGYNAQKIGFKYSTAQDGATMATLIKTANFTEAEKNEIPDRMMYRAGYVLAKETRTGRLDVDQFTRRSKSAYEKAIRLESEIKGYYKSYDQIIK